MHKLSIVSLQDFCYYTNCPSVTQWSNYPLWWQRLLLSAESEGHSSRSRRRRYVEKGRLGSLRQLGDEPAPLSLVIAMVLLRCTAMETDLKINETEWDEMLDEEVLQLQASSTRHISTGFVLQSYKINEIKRWYVLSKCLKPPLLPLS